MKISSQIKERLGKEYSNKIMKYHKLYIIEKKS